MADPVTTTGVGDVVGLIVGGGGSGIGGGALVWYLLQRKAGGNCSTKVEESLDKVIGIQSACVDNQRRVIELQEHTIANQTTIMALQKQALDQLDNSTNAVVQVANAISGLRGFMEGRMK